MSTQLTAVEHIDLERLEKVIDGGKKTFVSVGLALTEIRDRKLYRLDYSSFESYCQDKWGWTRQRSHQLIEAASVVKQLPSNLSTMVDTERAARELVKVEPAQRDKVMKAVKVSGVPVTAKAINIAAKVEVQHTFKDETGYPIPKNLNALWQRTPEVLHLLKIVSEVKCELETADKEDDPLWRECFLNKAVAELQSVYANLQTAKPFAVCTVCSGHPEAQPKGVCRGCKGRGFMSKFRYDRVPESIKKIRAKA